MSSIQIAEFDCVEEATTTFPLDQPMPSKIHVLWEVRRGKYFVLDFDKCALKGNSCNCRETMGLGARCSSAFIAYVNPEGASGVIDSVPAGSVELHELKVEDAVRHARGQGVDCIAVRLIREDYLVIPVHLGATGEAILAVTSSP